MEIKLKDISKGYGTEKNQFKALSEINLTINSGEIVSIVGPSGSGKSTLLSIMSGLDYPSDGKVFMGDIDLFSLPEHKLSEFRREHFGFVFQQFNLIPNFNVKENIELPLLFSNVSKDDKLLSDICEQLEIDTKTFNLPSQLSGGQQQRVAIARALISNPDIIFADEPTGNLDQKMGTKVIKLLKEVALCGKRTLIVVTHDEKIASVTNRRIILIDGKIVEDK